MSATIQSRIFGLPVCCPKKYSTIILPVVVYGCETWYLAFRKEHDLRLLENRVLRKIFGPKRDEVTGEWRKLHMIRMAETCRRFEIKDSCYVF